MIGSSRATNFQLGLAMRILLLIGVAVSMLLPFAWAVSASLQPLERVYAFPPELLPSSPQWENFRDALTRLPMVRFLANSTLIAITSTFGAVLTGSMMGFALAMLRFRGRRLLFFCVLLSMAIPFPVLLLPRYSVFSALGWVGTYKPLIVPSWLGATALTVLLFRQFFRRLPASLADAAVLDGATPWQFYRRVALPAVRPAVLTAALLSFVAHWQALLDPLIYLADFRTFPVALGLRMYQTMAGTWANLLMAASLIAIAPLVVLLVLFERQLMRGIGVVELDG